MSVRAFWTLMSIYFISFSNAFYFCSISRLALSNSICEALLSSPPPPLPTFYMSLIFSSSELNFSFNRWIEASISLIFFLFSSALAAASLSPLESPPPLTGLAETADILLRVRSLAVLSISYCILVYSSLMSSIVLFRSSNFESSSAWYSALICPPPPPPWL